MVRKRVAVIGMGYVGKAVFNFFKDHFDVSFFDPSVAESDKEACNSSDLAIICVPTPMSKDGSADLSYIESTFEWLKTPLVLIKSTIPPGTTKKLQTLYQDRKICFSPEYIGEGNYVVQQGKGYPDPLDMKKHDFVIIGGMAAQEVGEFFKRVLGPEPIYRFVDSTTAELCKYMENSFLATKVTFCNEFYEIAKTLGVEYDTLRELWLLDGRIGRSHTSVFKDSRGFGGKCLPKDVNALVRESEKNGYKPHLLRAVLATNDMIRSAANC